MSKLTKAQRDKHANHAKKIKADTEAALGTYAEGGPAIVIAKPEWDGLTKRLDNMTDEEYGAITSVVVHMSPTE